MPPPSHNYNRPVQVQGVDTLGLVDSGSVITLISGKLVKPNQLIPAKHTGVTHVHGMVNFYHSARVRMEIQGTSTKVLVGPTLPLLEGIFQGLEACFPLNSRNLGNPLPPGKQMLKGSIPQYSQRCPKIWSLAQGRAESKKDRGGQLRHWAC